MRVRKVDVSSLRYTIAHNYMTRLERDGFEQCDSLSLPATTTGTSANEFRSCFGYLIENEPGNESVSFFQDVLKT